MASKARVIALGGVLGTICVVSLYGAVYLPTNRLFFYGLSSVLCGVLLVESSVKWAWIFYGATGLLSFFIIPNKIGLVPYLLFFGIYGIIKYYTELTKNLALEIILKGIYFLLSMTATAVVVKEMFGGEVVTKLPIWGLAVLGLVVFYLYDYVYSLFISYYMKRIRNRWK